MKMYELNLETYEIEGNVYPLKDNLAAMLRAPGVFKTGEDIVEAVLLAKKILASSDVCPMDEHEAGILRACLNRHIEVSYENNGGFGGPLHEECILRVFHMLEKK